MSEAVFDSRDRLVAALRERGVRYLAPSDAAGEPVSDEGLIAALAQSDDPRLRQALIALFLVQPHLAPWVPKLRQTLPPAAETELIAGYMAAVYLQQMWWLRLARYLPGLRVLPDYFSGPLSLPAPQDEYGKAGLYALAAWQAQRSQVRANYLSEYEGVVGLLLEQLKLQTRHHVAAAGGSAAAAT